MFTKKNLSVLAYANGFTIWHYMTTDSTYDVLESGYFNKAIDMMLPHDLVIFNAVNGNRIAWISMEGDEIKTQAFKI